MSAPGLALLLSISYYPGGDVVPHAKPEVIPTVVCEKQSRDALLIAFAMQIRHAGELPLKVEFSCQEIVDADITKILDSLDRVLPH